MRCEELCDKFELLSPGRAGMRTGRGAPRAFELASCHGREAWRHHPEEAPLTAERRRGKDGVL